MLCHDLSPLLLLSIMGELKHVHQSAKDTVSAPPCQSPAADGAPLGRAGCVHIVSLPSSRALQSEQTP